MPRTFHAYPVHLAMRFAEGLFFAIYATMSLVYQAAVVGLNPLQLVLVGTVLEASYFLADVPTGVVADVYSRRLSIVIGFIARASTACGRPTCWTTSRCPPLARWTW